MLKCTELGRKSIWFSVLIFLILVSCNQSRKCYVTCVSDTGQVIHKSVTYESRIKRVGLPGAHYIEWTDDKGNHFIWNGKYLIEEICEN